MSRRAPAEGGRRCARRLAVPGLAVLWLAVALAPVVTPAAAGDLPRIHLLGEASVLLPAPAPGDTLKLPHRWIRPETLRLSCGGRAFVPGRDFTLDAGAGTILWRGARPGPGSALRASYRHLPLALPERWGLVAPAAGPETLALPLPAPPRSAALPPGAQLEVGGSKTLSLEFGNRRDARIDQSLDLTLRGRLADQVDVRAVLTDRGTPLQPEGTTTELADLDQVLIEVTAPWGEMRLGDITAGESRLGFLAHERPMEGLKLRAGKIDGRRATAALGRGGGRPVTLEFRGGDGKQGPYRLLGLGGLGAARMPGEEAVVVAGSDRVWVDGARQTRGEAEDYTIDYAAGELWFMPRRSITAVSEIRVSLQVREGVYERDYYALGAAASLGARSVQIGWARERDNPAAGAGAGLTAAERESLSAAGDALLALGGGARLDSLGGYVLVEADTAAVAFYLHVGEEAEGYERRYAVSFVDVGEGRGDYVVEQGAGGETYYRFAGRGLGRYLPGRRLTLPESRDVVALQAGGDFGGGLELWGEGALSAHDANVLSARDDGDNDGAAAALRGRWRPHWLSRSRPDLLELRVSGRAVGEHFASFEPLDPAFAYRRWNASSDSLLAGRDERGAASLHASPGAGLALSAGWEGLRAARGFDGRAWHAGLERRGLLQASGEIRRSATRERGRPGRGESWRARLGRDGAFAAGVGYRGERLLRGERGGESGDEYYAATVDARASALAPGLDAGYRGELRRDRAWAAGVRRADGERRLHETDLRYGRGEALAQLAFTRRELHPADGGAASRTDLADWLFSHRGTESWAGGEWRGRLTAAESRLRGERLRYVGSGVGHYDSLGQYVTRGDYELYHEPGDSSGLESRCESAARLNLRPGRLLPAGRDGGLAGLEGAFFGRIDVASPEELGLLLRAPAALVSGAERHREHARTLRGDLSWRGGARAPAPLARWEERRRRTRNASGFAREQIERSGLLETRWALRAGLQARFEVGAGREEEGVETGGGGRSRAERERERAAFEGSWSPRRGMTLRLGGELGRERYEPAAMRRTQRRATVGVAAEPFRAGRLEGSYERRWMDGEAPASTPFATERPGWLFQCSGSLRPRGLVSGSLSLRVAREEGRATVVQGRMELRAYF